MDPDDLRNDPHRQVPRLGLSWIGTNRGTLVGQSKNMLGGGPEDEAGRVTVAPASTSIGGPYSFSAEHYQPYNRGQESGSEHDPWQEKHGDFVVKSQHRAMIAGESLLRRLQTGSMS